MGEIRYIIIAKQCEVAGTSSILDGCLKKSFSLVYDLGKRFVGHPSCIDDVPCNLTQFCYNVVHLCLIGHLLNWYKDMYTKHCIDIYHYMVHHTFQMDTCNCVF